MSYANPIMLVPSLINGDALSTAMSSLRLFSILATQSVSVQVPLEVRIDHSPFGDFPKLQRVHQLLRFGVVFQNSSSDVFVVEMGHSAILKDLSVSSRFKSNRHYWVIKDNSPV